MKGRAATLLRPLAAAAYLGLRGGGARLPYRRLAGCRPYSVLGSRSPADKMKFLQFEAAGRLCIGVLDEGDRVVNMSEHCPKLSRDLRACLQHGEPIVREAERCLNQIDVPRLELSTLKLLPPIVAPDKVLCAGMNYRDHCAEQGAPVPSEPVVFNKFPSTLTATNEDIAYDSQSNEIDYEVELAIVIGRGGKNIQEKDAMKHVFGYTVANDLSARDWQMSGKNAGQWIIGKSLDRFCPIGPYIVTTDSLSDPHNLGLRTRVNGVVKQDSNTNQLVFKTEQLIAYITRFFSLCPGDVILTGTPPGVGVFRKPPEFLKVGDVVEVEIDEIGTVVNKFV